MTSKILVLFFVSVLSLFCSKKVETVSAYDIRFPQKTNFVIVVTGDSHAQNAPPNGYDSIWVNKVKYEFQKYYDTVTLINLAIGGTQIQDVMPGWYYQTDTRLNVDTCLKYDPDLILISMSGNHTVFSVAADTSIYCFKYLADTLRSLGRSFVFSGQAPRQKTFTPPITLQSYYDSSKKINSFLDFYCPDQWVDPYPTMEDTIYGKRPWPAALGPDSLHFSSNGNELYYQVHINNKIMDSCMSDYIGRAVNFKLIKSGGNLTLSGYYQHRKMLISGSNDSINFTLYKTILSSNTSPSFESHTFTDAGFVWYKFELISGRRKFTITKKIN